MDRVTVRVMARLGTEAVEGVRRRFAGFGHVASPLRLSAAAAALCLVIAVAGSFFMGTEPDGRYAQEAREGVSQDGQLAADWASAQSTGAVSLDSISLTLAVENASEGGELRILGGKTAQGITIRKRLRLVSEGGAVVIGRI